MIIYISVESPHRWAITEKNNRITQKGVTENLDTLVIPSTISRVIGVVPSSDVTIREVSVPARTQSQAEKAIPFALEDSLATDLESLHFSILDWARGKPATVAIVAQNDMRHWLEIMSDLSRPLDCLVPEILLLPNHPQASYSLVVKADKSVLIRGVDTRALVLQQDMIKFWWQEMNDPSLPLAVSDTSLARDLISQGGTMVREWAVGENFTEWFSHTPNILPEQYNLLKNKYEPGHRIPGLKDYRLVAGVALAAIMLVLSATTIETWLLSREARQLDGEIEEVFRSVFPDTRRLINPRLQFQQKIEQLRSGIASGDLPMLLNAVARAIPTSKATIEELSYRDNTLIVTCTTNDFSQLDQVNKRLTQDTAIKVELLSSGSRDKRVSGRFRLTRGDTS